MTDLWQTLRLVIAALVVSAIILLLIWAATA